MRGAIQLERELKVYRWNVSGTIARAERRDELHSVLLLAHEHERISHEDVDEVLLGGHRRTVAKRLLRICELYELLKVEDHAFCLTPLGHQAVEREEVFVPEDGTWTIWASDDPLLTLPGEDSCAILRAEPWEEPSAYDEVLGDKQNSDRYTVDLPSWLRSLPDAQYLPANRNPRQIRVVRLDEQAEEASAECRLSLVWKLSPEAAPSLSLEGKLAGESIRKVLPVPKRSYEEVWHQLLSQEGLLMSWDDEVACLRKSFEELTEKEKAMMSSSLTFARPNIGELGEFSSTKVSQVPLQAAGPQDAKDWAEWRLVHRYTDAWALEDVLKEWKEKAKEDFSKFRGEIELPSREEIARKLRPGNQAERPSVRYWFFQAPEDWSL